MEPMVFITFLLIVLILIDVPISFAIGGVSALYFFMSGVDLDLFPQRMISSLNSSTLFAIPLFLLAGLLMNHSGITMKIYNFAHALVGHVRGGLAHVNVLSAMMFATMTGSAVADLVGLGTISTKAMSEHGYPKRFAAALTLAACTITPIIPPSIILIIYSVVAEESIGRLFLAGVIPGILIGISLMIYSYFVSLKRGYPREERMASFRHVISTFRKAILPLLTPIIIVGGIIGGVFTATEAGAMAVAYVAILGFLVYRQLNWKLVRRVLLEGGITASAILFLISTSGVMGWIITMEQVPQMLADSMLSVTTNPFVILMLINVLIMIAGMFLDATPIVLMLVPVLLPIVTQIEVDPVHFGIIVGFNAMIGITTPPVGVGLYAITSALKLDVFEILREMWKMWIVLLIVLILITFIPQLSLFLPNLFFS